MNIEPKLTLIVKKETAFHEEFIFTVKYDGYSPKYIFSYINNI